MEGKYNRKSPAVKRLMREAMELSHPTPQYFAQPLEDNLFEWHFTVSGPTDSEFEGGRYHGRVILPPEYPMKPPSIILLTPNGRFETGKKICLSMSAHHPETWQPSWSIRTVLLALIGFMPTKGGGAIGAVDYTPQERRKLAKISQQWKCDICGSNSATVLAEVDESASPVNAIQEAQELASQINFKGEEKKEEADSTDGHQSTSTLPAATSAAPETSTVTTASNTTPQAASSSAEQPIPRRRIVNSTPNVPNASVSSHQTNSDPGYCSLVLMWIVALSLVILIIRRLCLETVPIQQTGN